MKRRDVIAGLASAAVLPSIPARAQRSLPVVGVLVSNPADRARLRLEAVRLGLREAGLSEGVDYVFALRFAEGDLDRLPGLARELAALKPSVVVGGGNGADVWHSDFGDVPLVFTGYAADPIKEGFAQTYARPGGNATGNVMNAIGGEAALARKRLGLLKELLPELNRIGFIGTRISGAAMAELDGLTSVSGQFGVEVVNYLIESIDEVEGVAARFDRDGVGALYVSGAPLLSNNLARVLPVIVASKKPTIATYVEWGRAGLLMSYATDLQDGYRRAGLYVAKILRGEKPGNLPIEQATKFTLVVNTRAAQQLGIVVPVTLLASADEVIE